MGTAVRLFESRMSRWVWEGWVVVWQAGGFHLARPCFVSLESMLCHPLSGGSSLV
jgi:hypothetical protein